MSLDGTATIPEGLPDLTLGFGVMEHATRWLRQPNGPRAGLPWVPVLSQARWLLWWYAVDEDGHWLFHHGARRLAKGSGKSPFAAVQCLEELTGPVRFDRFDAGAPGGCVGKPVDMPLVQIAATAESQTANTMRMVRAMAQKRSAIALEYGLDVGKTVFYTPTGGQLEIITSSAAAAEGAEPTFVIEDETEHWTPSSGGAELAGTLDRNLGKSGSRAIETANAWEPGVNSVAETTFDAWQAQEEGRTRHEDLDTRILYDARIAPADTDLRSRESVDRGLDFVYDDCFWVPKDTIRGRVWDLRTKEDISRRFYFNQPTAAEDAWVTPMEWNALYAGRVIADQEEIVLFFDGSKSNDATGLVGCAISDGHVFTLDAWEPNLEKGDWEVPAHEVDDAVARAFDKYDVLAFFADVQEWQGFTKVTWPDRHGDGLLIAAVPGGRDPQPIAWDMRSHTYDFTIAAELTNNEIVEKSFTHDGDSRMERHVVNARRRPNRWGISIGKESRTSSKKVDLAVCMVGARMVRRIVLGSPAWKKRQHRGAGKGRVIVLG